MVEIRSCLVTKNPDGTSLVEVVVVSNGVESKMEFAGEVASSMTTDHRGYLSINLTSRPLQSDYYPERVDEPTGTTKIKRNQ